MKVNKGYTLIELLLTISIISVIASIGLVSVSQAKIRSKNMDCKNKLRNIGMYMHMQSQINGRLPMFSSNSFGYLVSRDGKFNKRNLICDLDANYTANLDNINNMYSSYSLNQDFSGKLLDKVSGNSEILAYDSVPRHDGKQNAVTVDLQIIIK